MSAVAESVERELVARALAAPPESLWAEYDRLRVKFDARTLTPDEHAELIRLSDRLEEIHVDRLTAVFELAAMRGRPHQELMVEYGVVPRVVTE